MPIGLLNNTFIQDLRKSLLVRNLNPTTEANLGGLASLNLDRGQPTETSLSQGEYVPLNQESVVTLGHYPLKTMGLKNRYAPESYPVHEIADNLTLGGNIGTYDNYVRTQTSRTFDLKQFILGGGAIRTDIDTPLGVIGAEQLKSALEANIAQNTIKNTLGRVNLNLFSLLNGEEFLIRDYSITTFPNRGLGFFANLGQKYTGFEIPVSYIPSDAFGFLDSLFDGKVIYGDCKLEDLVAYKDYSRMDGIDRNNNLLLYTGRGNRVQLFNLLGINKYRPNYDNNPNEDGALNRIFGYLQQRKNNDKASYDTLAKTRRSSGMLDVMGRQGIANPTSGAEKGKTGAYVRDDARSVIQQNGLPKITWTNKDKPGNLKRFMFSIENLAWIGNTDGLPECELGNGDPNSDDKRPGRIMWFPPYDLTFDESVSVQWDKNNFIGRGEPIFTYNNTTRSGTIKFRLVVDHPSILNEIRQSGLFDDSDYVKFFKGLCNDFIGGGNYIDGALSLLDQASYIVSRDDTDAAATKIVKTGQDNQEKNANATTKAGSTKQFNTKIFFANNSSTVDSSYQNGGGFNLNGSGEGFASTSTSSNISNISSDSVEKVEVTISTSYIENESDGIAKSRYEAAASWIRSQISGVEFDIRNGQEAVQSSTSNDPNAITEINNRWALIEVVPFLKDLKNSGGTEDTKPYSDNNVQDQVQTIVYKVFSPVYSECDYFKFLEKTRPLIFQSMSAKLKYFNPGFHSTTPEGLNSRLTFLHQCTRQGPSIDPQAKTSNLAFGRPPICILRIGDFFHTKMVIESMSISYDEGVLWDLNPEGIGLQPRLATVSLTVSYLGGQSLMAPIRELQNALGYNFYANTETFQHAPKQIASVKVVVDNTSNNFEDSIPKKDSQYIVPLDITQTALVG